VARGTRFFNAHPYLAGLAVGAAARAEHEGVPPAQIERLRTALSGPLGSFGDRLVWAGWLPLLSALALAGVALGAGWMAVAGFLVLYNLGHVLLRSWALRAGWRHGARVAVALQTPVLQRASRLVGPAMAVASGFAFPLLARYLGEPLAPPGRIILAAVTGAGLLLLWWRPGHLTGVRLGLGVVAAALVAAWLWP
jgi:PTS system mannose-specific IID component